MTKVAVLDDYLDVAPSFADWDALAPGVDVTFFTQTIAPGELTETLAPFDVLVLMRERTKFGADVLAPLANLKLVITTGMRNASLDVDHLLDRGVVVCGTEYEPGDARGVPTTCEIAWALIFATLKRVRIEDHALREGRWQTGLPVNLAGATLGLLGLGHLGSAMVAPAKAFGMEVLAWSANLTPERAAEHGAAAASSKHELLARADVVSIHLILSRRTAGMIGAAELDAMKDSAVLINTSRGPIIDEDALVTALRDGTIAAAGLDVYDSEPLPAGHPLTECETAVLLPHLGYVNEPGLRRMYEQIVENIAAWCDGSPIRELRRATGS